MNITRIISKKKKNHGLKRKKNPGFKNGIRKQSALILSSEFFILFLHIQPIYLTGTDFWSIEFFLHVCVQYDHSTQLLIIICVSQAGFMLIWRSTYWKIPTINVDKSHCICFRLKAIKVMHAVKLNLGYQTFCCLQFIFLLSPIHCCWFVTVISSSVWVSTARLPFCS